MGKTTVITKLSIPGFHCWTTPTAGVEYLAARHRHQFVIRVGWPVSHDDRDVEFHTALSWMRQALSTFEKSEHGIEFGNESCEMIARRLWCRLTQDITPIGIAPKWIEVSEDDECRALVEWP